MLFRQKFRVSKASGREDVKWTCAKKLTNSWKLTGLAVERDSMQPETKTSLEHKQLRKVQTETTA